MRIAIRAGLIRKIANDVFGRPEDVACA